MWGLKSSKFQDNILDCFEDCTVCEIFLSNELWELCESKQRSMRLKEIKKFRKDYFLGLLNGESKGEPKVKLEIGVNYMSSLCKGQVELDQVKLEEGGLGVGEGVGRGVGQRRERLASLDTCY